MMTPRRIVRALALLPVATLASCAGGLELAAIGAAFQGTTFASGVYKQGRLSVVEEAEIEMVERAALLAVDQLALTRRRSDTRSTDPSIQRLTIYVRDDADNEIAISTRRLSQRLTLLEVDVGSFGMEPLVRAVMLRIRTNLFEELRDAKERAESPDPFELLTHERSSHERY